MPDDDQERDTDLRGPGVQGPGVPDFAQALDATQLKALAHPMRMRLVGLLRKEGPATATGLAQRTGTNSGQTSYHLRQLAEVGLVEDDPDHGDGRERWWRSAHRGSAWRSGNFVGDPDASAADSWLIGHILRRHSDVLSGWHEERSELPVDWLDASDISDYWLTITPERLLAMTLELHAVVQRYVDEDDDDPTARDVTVHLHAFPTPSLDP